MKLLSTVLALLALPVFAMTAATPTVAEAKAFMDRAEAELLKMTALGQRAEWVQETYITDDTELLAASQNERLIARTTELIDEGKRFESIQLPPDLKRKFLLLKLSLTMPAPKNAQLREELTQIAASLDGSYGKGKYCPDPNKESRNKEKCLGIDDLEEKIAKSRDPKEIAAMWVGWHKIGAPMRERYARFVELSNQGARELGFADTGALWRSGYDMSPEQYSADLERVWSEVAPLYKELHTYIRRKLIQKYGAAAERKDGMIPAHLLGNMWAQEWGNVYDLAAPPAAPASYDIGEILQQRKTTAKQVVQYGEGFFRSLGLETLPDTFWERSMFTKPADRDVVCHASAWHMDLDRDVRLKVCLHDTTDDFVTVHHELGHIYYYLAYRKQPFLFRSGANDGFHEAIGDAIALSITPEYLKKIGLIEKIPPPEADLPLLLRTAMDKIAFLPFGLMIDKWRWEVFSGQVKPADYNKAWWQLREQYQGVAPPFDRSEADFDPGAKYHIPANTPYARYFMARIYQFQFYRAMCRAAGYTGPLNRCSVFGSKAAGDKLEAMLKLGQSKPWQEAMKTMTGEDRIDASAMVEYFQPLLSWLKQQNKGEKAGWTVAANPLKH
jgi:peptidyl-dipeptidase A